MSKQIYDWKNSGKREKGYGEVLHHSLCCLIAERNSNNTMYTNKDV